MFDRLPGEKIYGFVPPFYRHAWGRGEFNLPETYQYAPEEIVPAMAANGVDALYLLDPEMDDLTASVLDDAKTSGMEAILGFYADVENDPVGADRLIRKGYEIADALAVGNNGRCKEWDGGASRAVMWRAAVEAVGAEWICPLGFWQLAKDACSETRPLRGALSGVRCISLCGYILAGYLYADPRMPHQGRKPTGEGWTGLTGRDLYHRDGLTIPKLRSWLTGMDVISGAGFHFGLRGGSRLYAHALGFTGVICGLPFNLKNTLNVPINDERDEYPGGLGLFDKGYRLPKALTESCGDGEFDA